MSFARMQEALRAEGWFVEWNLPCCQSCAWGEVEHTDMTKVLFNHSQDCEVDLDVYDCPACDGEGEDEGSDCGRCDGEGYLDEQYDGDHTDLDETVSGFTCFTPEAQNESNFCFDGSNEGVANFKAIIPLIEASGCKVNWNGSGDTRPDISWKY